MSSPSHLRIEVEGATPGEIQRGLEAAQRVFDDAGVTAFAVAMDYWNRDQWEFGLDIPLLGIAELWREADIAAAEACCAGWAKVPDSARLGLTDEYRNGVMRLHPEKMEPYLAAIRRRDSSEESGSNAL